MIVMTLSKLSQYSTFEDEDEHINTTTPNDAGTWIASYFAVRSDGNDVDGNQNHPENQAERPPWEVICPVLQDQLQSNQVCGGGDGIIEPVVPGQGETKSIVDKASVPRKESTRGA